MRVQAGDAGRPRQRGLSGGAAVGLVLASAGLHALAFPPWNVSLAAWVALTPWFLTIHHVRLRRAFALGVLWGVAAHWAEAYWVVPAMSEYYQQPLWFAVLFGLGSSLLFRGLHYGLFAATACGLMSGRRGVPRALATAALWVAFELLRARGPTADPWLLLGYALVRHPLLLQAADLGGIALLSFVIALANAALAEAVDAITLSPAGKRGAAFATLRLGAGASVLSAVIGVAALAVYGNWRLAMPLVTDTAVPITIVQGNNDLGTQWRQEYYGQGLETYLALSREAAERWHPRVLVWPESAVTFFLAREPRFLDQIRAMLLSTGTTLLTGAPHYEDVDPALPAFFNSAFYVTPDGIQSRYDKVRLLPFAEYFPLRFVEFLRRRFGRIRSFTPGVGAPLLDTSLGRVAVVICFEAVFAEFVRDRMRQGADLLVSLSNDAWFGHGSGPEQHLAMVVPRAVENRTWILRATTTGISAVIDPYGVVHDATPRFARTAIDAEVAPAHTVTLYQSWGDWFAWLCVLICGALAVRRATAHWT